MLEQAQQKIEQTSSPEELIANIALTTFLIATVRFIILRDGRTWKEYFVSLFIAGSLSTVIHLYLAAEGTENSVEIGIIFFSGFFATDLLTGLAKLGVQFRRDPLKFIKEAKNIMRGEK